MASTIFIVDSSPAVRRMVEQISTPEGFEVLGFQDGPAALEAAQKLSPRLIIVDYHLDNMTFSGFCKKVYETDSLTNTYIVSLISTTDKFDESHLKSLGVKAFLKKPFQSENLLDLIKELHQTSSATNGSKKKRSWPPTSSATDYEDDSPPNELTNEPLDDEDLKITIPFPAQTKTPAKKEAPMAPTPITKQSATEPEEAMKGLFGQLLQSMSEKTEKKITELLPQMVSKDLAELVAKAVEREVHQQLGAGLSEERLAETIEPILTKALPKVLSSEMALLEPIIRHSIFEIANPLIKENIDHLVLEQAKTVNTTLPDVIREHLKSIEGQVQEEIKQAAAAQTEKLAADIVRAAANEQIQQTIQKLVPAIAEEQIRAEISRLSEAA